MSEKKKRIIYWSEGNDEMSSPCDSVEEAVNMFTADAGSVLDKLHDGTMHIRLSLVEMTDEEVAALPEM